MVDGSGWLSWPTVCAKICEKVIIGVGDSVAVFGRQQQQQQHVATISLLRRENYNGNEGKTGIIY